MTKIFLKAITGLFLTAIISGCAYYKYTKNRQDKYYKSDKPDQWKELDKRNILVVHSGSTLKEIYDVTLNKETNVITGNIRPLDATAMYYYNKIMQDEDSIARREKKRVSKIATKQVHFFLKKAEIPDSTTMKFVLSDIEKVDVSEQADVNILINLGIAAGIAAVGGGVFLLIACNCPHVYVDNGSGLQMNNSMYTGAKAPQLERFDYKQLPDYFKDSSSFSLSIVNELNENQYTNMLELMVAVHTENVEIVADKQGSLHTIQAPQLPVQAADNNSNSILKDVSLSDKISYKFNADNKSELSEALLTFKTPEDKPLHGKLILRLRNSPWSAHVYHEFITLFGKNYSKWVEKNKDQTKEKRELWMREQGILLQVEVKTDKGWQSAGEVDLMGEANFNSIVVPVKIPPSSKNLEIRLRSGFMFWELDYAAVDFSPNQKIEIQKLKPQSATGSDGQDFTQALSFDDDLYMEHMGKESSTKVTFKSLHTNPELKRTLILRSKGYYISKDEFTGKTHLKELKKFKNPGQLSRFSRDLYFDIINRTAKN